MHLVLTGATGLVGSAVLQQMLTTPSVTKLTILSRRPVAQAEGHTKANVVIHKDFSNYGSEVMEGLKDVKGVVWAQGISVNSVDKDEYERITYTYPLAFARALSTSTSPKPVNFVYISGEGATTTPAFYTPRFGVVKGRAEASLLALSKDAAFSNLRPFTFRPGGVDPSAHDEIKPFLPTKNGLQKKAEGVLIGGVRWLMPSQISPTRELGAFAIKLASGDGERYEEGTTGVSGEGRTFSNGGFRSMVGL